MKFSVPFLTLMFLALVLVVAHPADAQVWRVDQSATGANNGTSWQNAFTTIQPAINAAHAAGGGQVWVAGGPIGSPVVYNELRTEVWGPGGQAGSLVMKDNVHVYGGFEGWRGGAGVQETALSQRVLAQNIAVIDGSVSNWSFPAMHVVVFGRAAAATVNARLDGFHITGGNASGDGANYHTYRGGGIYNWRSDPVIANCYIYGNTARVSGGGVANEGTAGAPGNAQYINCVIADNIAQRNLDNVNSPVRGGGGVYINRSTPTLTHVTIAGNTTGAGGTGPGNTTNYGLNSGGIYTHTHSGLPSTASVLLSGIIWNNTGGNGIINEKTDTLGGGGAIAMTATYSNIAGGYAGTGNLNANPNFSGAFPWAYQITGAPCVDAGSSSINNDIRGVPRPLGAGRDMGAYEYSPNGPVAVCAAHTVILDGSCSGSLTVDDIDGGSSAQAGIWKRAASQTSFGSGDIGGNTVQLTVTDILGRTGNCNATVTVQDNIPPVITSGPTGQTLNLNASCQVAIPNITGTVTATDNCGIASTTQSPPAGTLVNSNTLVTVTVTDLGGNPAQGSAWITVQDVTPPVITTCPPDRDVSLDSNCQATVPDLILEVTASDNCGIASVTQNPTAGTPMAGDVSVLITVTDTSSLTAQCTVELTLVDTTAPVITVCPDDDDLILDANCEALVPDLTGDVVATDNCTAVNDLVVTQTPAAGATIGKGANPVTLRVTDEAGNWTECVVVLTGIDATPPIITLLGSAYTTVEQDETYADDGATAFDACDGNISGDIVTDGLPIDTSELGINYVTYNVSDSAGNPAVEVVRTVYVVGIQPVVTNVTVETGWTVLVTFSKAMSVDALAVENYAVSGSGVGTLSGLPQSVAHVSGNTYRLTWSGAEEMFDGGDITITVNPDVQDNDGYLMGTPNVMTHAGGAIGEAPVITLFGADEFLECGVDTFVEAGAEAIDNVDGPVAVDTSGADLVSDAEVGVYVITYTAVDAAGNTAVETRTVTVEDGTDPEIALNGEAFISLECNLEWYVEYGASAWDACDGDLTSEVLIGAPANTSVLGLQVVAYSVTDGEGNAATVERTIEVVDTTAPTIALLGDNPYVTSDGTTYVEPGATAWDVCDGDLTDEIVIGGDDPNTTTLGVYVVTYTVSDGSDNVASASRSVVVKPEGCDLAFALEITPNPAVPGQTVTLEVVEVPGSCSVGALDYIWQKAPMAAKSDFSVIPDAPNAAIFTIASVSYEDAGAYMCTVSDASDTFDTQPVTLVVTTGIPAVGGFGLAIAAAAAALAGIVALRKRR